MITMGSWRGVPALILVSRTHVCVWWRCVFTGIPAVSSTAETTTVMQEENTGAGSEPAAGAVRWGSPRETSNTAPGTLNSEVYCQSSILLVATVSTLIYHDLWLLWCFSLTNFSWKVSGIIHYLEQMSHMKSGTTPGILRSTISRIDSTWRQMKNLQTLVLVMLPTYCTLLRELFCKVVTDIKFVPS